MNLPITSQRIPTYLCPSMGIPRPHPMLECNKRLAPGSYLISHRTSYYGWGEPDGAFAEIPPPGKDYRLNMRHIKDGLTKTLLIGEINYAHRDFKWTDCGSQNGSSRWGDQTWAHGYWFLAWGHVGWDEYDYYERRLFNENDEFVQPKGVRVFRSDHPGGAQFVTLDGAVRFLTDEIDYPILRALVTRACAEPQH